MPNARIDALDKSLNTRIDNVEPRIDESRIDESDENLTDIRGVQGDFGNFAKVGVIGNVYLFL